MTNLVANAGEAIPKGGLTVSVTNACIDLPTAGYENLADGEDVLLGQPGKAIRKALQS